MKWIATQTYSKVERQVTRTEQKMVEHERELYLYDDKIVTHYRIFPIHEVFDMSYRRMGGPQGGLLYLHTSKGVYSYVVKEDPISFIEAFKELV